MHRSLYSLRLRDENNDDLKQECEHPHSLQCDSCKNFKSVVEEMQTSVKNEIRVYPFMAKNIKKILFTNSCKQRSIYLIGSPYFAFCQKCCSQASRRANGCNLYRHVWYLYARLVCCCPHFRKPPVDPKNGKPLTLQGLHKIGRGWLLP